MNDQAARRAARQIDLSDSTLTEEIERLNALAKSQQVEARKWEDRRETTLLRRDYYQAEQDRRLRAERESQ